MHIEEAELKSFLDELGLGSPKDLTESDLSRAKAYLLGIPFVDLKREKFDLKTLSLIPEPLSRNHNVVAWKKGGSGIEVVMLEREDLDLLNFLEEKTGEKLLPRLTDGESMRHALLEYQKLLKTEFGELIQRGLPTQNGIAIVDALFGHALLQNVSDLHIEPHEKEIVVRYRVSGRLYDAMVLPRKSALAILVRIKSLAGLSIEESESPQEGHFVLETDKEKVFIKVSIVPTLYGEKLVLRLAKENAKGFTLESLGFSGEGLEALHNVLDHSAGTVLITGPRNSGKSTTLYTLLDLVNRPSRSISTIEDPIEYRLPRINQTQVMKDKGITLLSGLRALMRQDPDVIMINELVLKEEIDLALQASSSRRLVVASLEGSTSAGLLSQLVGKNIDPLLITSHLRIVVAQRLVRKLAREKIKYHLNKKELESLGKSVDLERMLKILKQEKIVGSKDTWEKVSFYKPKSENDFDGVTGLQEVLRITPTMQNLIKSAGTATDFELQAKKEGMITLLEDGILKATRGLTTIEEVLANVSG